MPMTKSGPQVVLLHKFDGERIEGGVIDERDILQE